MEKKKYRNLKFLWSSEDQNRDCKFPKPLVLRTGMLYFFRLIRLLVNDRNLDSLSTSESFLMVGFKPLDSFRSLGGGSRQVDLVQRPRYVTILLNFPLKLFNHLRLIFILTFNL